MPSAEAQDTFVIGHKRTAELDRGRNQQPVCGVAVFEMMKLIAPRSRTMSKRHRLDAGTLQEPFYPRANRKIQVNAPRIDEQRHLPDGDGAEANGSIVSPATIDHGLRCRTQPVIAAIEP